MVENSKVHITFKFWSSANVYIHGTHECLHPRKHHMFTQVHKMKLQQTYSCVCIFILPTAFCYHLRCS